MIEFPPINRGVPLLNKFLGLKTPQSPSALSQLVQPTAELLPWWMWSAENFTFDGGEVISVAELGFQSFSTLLVPENSTWLVLEWTVKSLGGAGVNFTIVPAYDYRGLLRFFAHGSGAAFAADGGLIDCFANKQSPLYLPAKSQLGVYILSNAGAASAVEAYVRIVQFEN